METTSPRGRDLQERRRYALHASVPDDAGTGGEFALAGSAVAVDDPGVRAVPLPIAGTGPRRGPALAD
jgi:hypothetical protein